MWQILKHFSRHFRQAHTQKLLDVNILMLNLFSIFFVLAYLSPKYDLYSVIMEFFQLITSE